MTSDPRPQSPDDAAVERELDRLLRGFAAESARAPIPSGLAQAAMADVAAETGVIRPAQDAARWRTARRWFPTAIGGGALLTLAAFSAGIWLGSEVGRDGSLAQQPRMVAPLDRSSGTPTGPTGVDAEGEEKPAPSRSIYRPQSGGGSPADRFARSRDGRRYVRLESRAAELVRRAAPLEVLESAVVSESSASEAGARGPKPLPPSPEGYETRILALSGAEAAAFFGALAELEPALAVPLVLAEDGLRLINVGAALESKDEGKSLRSAKAVEIIAYLKR
ncbi:MAG: hypothetical protein JNJ88_06630 [Planctomycetes bacterium]|nr:hypothetical protein [Planctomycetota bacterium]